MDYFTIWVECLLEINSINIQVDLHSQTTLLLGISRISMKSSYVDFKAGSFFEDSGDELVDLS